MHGLSRWGGVASVGAALLCWLLSPMMVTIGLCHGVCGSWMRLSLFARLVAPYLTDWGLLAADPDVLYFAYGRWFCLVYVGLAIGVLGLHSLNTHSAPPPDRLTRYGFRLLFGATLCAAFGDFLGYGIGVFSTWAWRNGFGIEVISWIGMLIGSLLYGAAILRVGRLPRWVGWLVIVAGLLLPLSFAIPELVGYAPNAQIMPYSLVWLVLGIFQIRAQRQ